VTPHDPPKPTPADQPAGDFREITGIGATYERRLHDAGILTYQDLAARSPDQLAEVTGVSAARIASEDWIGQARRLAGPPGPPPSEPSQHYASFHVEFLLDVDDSVRRTKVHHHQSDADFTWPGWDEDRLLALLREHIPLTASRQPAEANDLRSSVVPPASRSETAAPSKTQPETVSPPIGLVPSALRIEEFALIHKGQRTYTWAPREPASVRLSLCVSRTRTLRAGAFDFAAAITARRKLGDRQRLPLGRVQGTVRVGEPVSVDLTGPALPRGLYRLEADVLLYPSGRASDSPPLHARHVLGALIHVAGDALAPTTPVPT
jgi:hypothetical protein